MPSPLHPSQLSTSHPGNFLAFSENISDNARFRTNLLAEIDTLRQE
jgi:hypothetical protein